MPFKNEFWRRGEKKIISAFDLQYEVKRPHRLYASCPFNQPSRAELSGTKPRQDKPSKAKQKKKARTSWAKSSQEKPSPDKLGEAKQSQAKLLNLLPFATVKSSPNCPALPCFARSPFIIQRTRYDTTGLLPANLSSTISRLKASRHSQSSFAFLQLLLTRPPLSLSADELLRFPQHEPLTLVPSLPLGLPQWLSRCLLR